MPIKNIIRSMINDYFVIITGIIACQVIMRLIFSPDSAITIIDLASILVGGAISTLPHLAFLSTEELSKEQWKKRRILHFIILELTVMGLAYIFGWLEGAGLFEHIVFMLSVLVVYLLVWMIGWQIDRSNSELINQKLAELHDNDNEL